MKQLRGISIAVLLLVSWTGEAGAQRAGDRWKDVEAAVPELQMETAAVSGPGSVISLDLAGASSSAWQSPHLVDLVFAGVMGGAVGFAGGALLGYMLAPEQQTDYDLGPIAAVGLGGVAGETVLLPLGVHLANERRGSYGLALAASTGIALGGLVAVVNTSDFDAMAVLVSIPVAQLAASIAIERASQ